MSNQPQPAQALLEGVTYPENMSYQITGEDSPKTGFSKLNGMARFATPAGIMQQTSVPAGAVVTVPAGYQLVIYGEYAVIGTLDLKGDLIVQ